MPTSLFLEISLEGNPHHIFTGNLKATRSSPMCQQLTGKLSGCHLAWASQKWIRETRKRVVNWVELVHWSGGAWAHWKVIPYSFVSFFIENIPQSLNRTFRGFCCHAFSLVIYCALLDWWMAKKEMDKSCSPNRWTNSMGRLEGIVGEGCWELGLV